MLEPLPASDVNLTSQLKSEARLKLFGLCQLRRENISLFSRSVNLARVVTVSSAPAPVTMEAEAEVGKIAPSLI